MKKWLSILCLAALLLTGCNGEKTPETEPEETAATTVAPTEMSEEEKQQILQSRRDTAEAHMRYMMSFLWQTDVSIDYSYRVGSLGVSFDDPDQILHLEAGRIYSGMPYTHGSAGAESFLAYGTEDENGVV